MGGWTIEPVCVCVCDKDSAWSEPGPQSLVGKKTLSLSCLALLDDRGLEEAGVCPCGEGDSILCSLERVHC